jgi:hypothetical protein
MDAQVFILTVEASGEVTPASDREAAEVNEPEEAER